MKDRITEVSIIDTYGTARAVFSPKSVTILRGANGSGKSSIIRGIGYVFAGGKDPSVIRKGAKKSVVSFTLASGTTVTKTTTPKTATVEIIDRDGLPVAAPQSFINDLSESVAIDPGVILRMDATTAAGRKSLAELLLRIMPIEFSAEELTVALTVEHVNPRSKGDRLALVVAKQEAALDVDGIKKLDKQIRDMRARVGVERDEAGGTERQLRGSLPEDDGADYSSLLVTAEQEKADLDRQVAAVGLEIESARQTELQRSQDIHAAAGAEIDAEIDATIRDLERDRSKRKTEAAEAAIARREKISSFCGDELTKLSADAKPHYERLGAEIATLKERAAAHERATGIRDQIEFYSQKAYAAAIKYDAITKALEQLGNACKSKLDSLPIPGLVVSEGNVFVDGIEWQNLNTAGRVSIAVQLSTLRSGALSFLILDDAEHLDTETRKELERAVVEAGYQIVEALVDDCPLKIETVASIA